MKTAIFLAIGLLVVVVQVSATTKYVCKKYFYIGRNATDCSKWFVCVFGHPFAINCGSGTVFSIKYSVCVHPGSDYDDCPVTVTPSPVDQCKAGFVHRVFSKPDNCAQFYNCSLPRENPRPGYLGDYIDECPYPKLFSERTKKCENFTTVNCGSRKEIKYACNYQKLQCSRSHCIPCAFRYPDCRGLSDGFHVWEEKRMSPYYAHCFSERGTPKTCPAVNGKGQLFSPDTRTCVEASKLFN